MAAGLTRIDHLVYAAPHLGRAVDQVEWVTGIRATTGGSHPGMGTRNALISLGPLVYLEIVAPDPEQLEFRAPRVFRIDTLEAPRIVTWAAKGSDLEKIAATEFDGDALLGTAIPGSRRNPNGEFLEWKLTDPYRYRKEGIVPFFIDWGVSPHPADTAATGATLASFRVEHPDPDYIRKIFDTLGLLVPVTSGDRPALIAEIETPKGLIELR